MAATTGTSIAPAINTEHIDALTLGYTRENAFLAPLFRNKNIVGVGSLKADFNSYGALAAAATTPGTDLTPTELSVGEDGTVTASEKGVAVEPTLLALETAAGRVDEDGIAREIGAAIAEKLQSDIATAFASLTNSTGSSGVNFSLANFEDALYQLRSRKLPVGAPPDFNLPSEWARVFSVMPEIQYADFITALRTAGASLVQSSFSLDGIGSAMRGAVRGEYMGVPIFATANNTTANASADVVGFMGVAAALGITMAAMPQVLMQDWVLGRSKYIVGRAVYGVGVIKDAYGQKLVTDA